MTTTTTPQYPRLPELAPQRPDETLEQYGLRALAFVVATDITASLPTRALELASYTYRIAIANRDLLQVAIDRLATIDSAIAQALRTRAELKAAGQLVADGASNAPAGRDKPAAGPMAPLAPVPIINPPAAPARRAPIEMAF